MDFRSFTLASLPAPPAPIAKQGVTRLSAEEVPDAVNQVWGEASLPLGVPGALCVSRALEVPGALVHQCPHAFGLAGLKPEAMLLVTGIELQVVAPVIKGDHLLPAGRATQRRGAGEIFDGAGKRYTTSRTRLELLKLIEVEPTAATFRANVMRNVVRLGGDKGRGIDGTN